LRKSQLENQTNERMTKSGLSNFRDNFPAQYFINEYNQFFKELRWINDKTAFYIKVFLSLLYLYIA